MSDIKVLDVDTVDESQLPSIIGNQFDALTELENNVQKAVNLAAAAKKKASDAQVSAGWFRKKEAIELLQTATQGLAEAQISAAEAQKISFKYQTKLTEITKFLFGLGVSNIAMNRSVVRELELKLKGASDEEISDLAKQELRNVIMQLKAQEDIMNKQSELSKKVKNHEENLSRIECIAEHHEQQISDVIEKDTLQDSEIEAQAKKDAEHDRLIAEIDKKYSEITNKLNDDLSILKNIVDESDKKIVDTISELSEILNSKIISLNDELNKINSNLSLEINNLAVKTSKSIDNLINEILIKNNDVDSTLENLKNRIDNLDRISSRILWKTIVSAVAIGALILNILHICHIL